MSDKILQTRIKLCSKTSSAWATESTIPLIGEVCIEWVTSGNTTFPRVKVGDGENIFASLPYVDITEAEVQTLIDAVANGKVDKVTGKGLSTEDFTTAEKTKLSNIASGATAVAIDDTLTVAGDAADAKAVGDILAILTSGKVNNVTLSQGNNNGTTTIIVTKNGVDSSSTAQIVKGLASAAYTESSAYATSADGALARAAMPVSGGTFTGTVTLDDDPENDMEAATKQYVDNAISARMAASDAMVLKGTVGTGGTFASLPTTDVVKGDTYKVVEAGTYAGNTCKVGDLLVAMDTGDLTATIENWLLVPSGDVESTSIKYSTSTSNLSTTAQTGEVILGFAATKQVDTSISPGSTSTKLPTTAAVAGYVDTGLSDKVDKVTGKGLSTEDFTAALKTKLEGIETGATNVTVDSSLSNSSTNPLENRAIYEGLDSKVDKVTGKGLSTEDYTTAEKTKLSGIETGATNVTVDSELSDSSNNAIANAAVKSYIDSGLEDKVDKVTGKGLSTEDFTTAEKTKLSNVSEYASEDNRLHNFAGKTGAIGIWAGSLFMRDGSGCYQNICVASDGTLTTENATTNTTKIRNQNGFEIGSPIWTSEESYAEATNITDIAAIYSSRAIPFDARYSFNVINAVGSLTAYSPVYLVGSIASDHLFYLDETWWTQNPTTSGKVYILIGGVYDSTSSNVRITLYEENTWLVYNGSKLIPLYKYLIDGKVDKDGNKVLSEEDFTSALKAKLNALGVDASITENGTNPVRSSAVYTALAGKVDKENGKGLSTENFTTALKNKLNGIEAGAEVNVNADWNSNSGDSQILNKPTIPDSLSDLTDDLGVMLSSDMAAITTTEIDDMFED